MTFLCGCNEMNKRNILFKLKAWIYQMPLRECHYCGNDCTFSFTNIYEISFCSIKCVNEFKHAFIPKNEVEQ